MGFHGGFHGGIPRWIPRWIQATGFLDGDFTAVISRAVDLLTLRFHPIRHRCLQSSDSQTSFLIPEGEWVVDPECPNLPTHFAVFELRFVDEWSGPIVVSTAHGSIGRYESFDQVLFSGPLQKTDRGRSSMIDEPGHHRCMLG